MPRRFTDATALFADLLDRHETGTESPIAYPDYASFASVVAADNFIKDLRRAEETGAVRIATGSGSRRDQVAHVRLVAPAALYRHIGRRPVGELAGKAHADLVRNLQLHAGLAEAASDVRSAWSRAKAWHGFTPTEADKLRGAFRLAQSVLDGQHAGVDYRTFSRRVTGDSKTLERVEGAVVRLLSGLVDLPPGARPRDALRALGLEKFAPPLLISGRVSLGDADMSRNPLPYLGLPPGEVRLLQFNAPPSYLLTIENFASFNRHAIEADPGRHGVTVYVGGYPSLATQQALRLLAELLPNGVPAYHWSDIDPDGIWIFRTIEVSMGRNIRPHLMSQDIAEQHGRAVLTRSIFRSPPAESGISQLAVYLAGPDAKTLEQEELDPSMPHPT